MQTAREDVGPGQLPQLHQVPPLRFQPLLLRSRQPDFLLRHLDTHRQDQLRVLCLSFMPLQIWSKGLAVSGILTMGLALLGCVGALKELRCLLGLYFGILLLLFATQITLGILISTQRIRLERRVKDIVLQTIQMYRTDPEKTEAEESWDYVQFQLRCCGWNSPQDWFHVPSLRSNESEVPRVPCSCYNSSATNDSAVFDMISLPQFSRLGPPARPRQNTDFCVVPANSYIYREGCARNLQKWLHNNLISIVGICLGVGLLELHDALDIPVQKPGQSLRQTRSVPLGPALPKAPPRPLQGPWALP
ncbi:leukocyte antigen CD37 isoform X2 [Manis javanica]|uniref:leukocyte antigen CD37 isoform X2 n=1 Tax=Manis javanica TaxID=9974 RepID=UPI0018794CA5|nr:leukocyte antigen CD37 isoform X2 [Manis javanica]